jgi:hypothetical protein
MDGSPFNVAGLKIAPGWYRGESQVIAVDFAFIRTSRRAKAENASDSGCWRIDAPFQSKARPKQRSRCLCGPNPVPELREEDVVILDNLSIQKTPSIAKLIAARGAVPAGGSP